MSSRSSRLAGLRDYIFQREFRLSLKTRTATTSGEECGHSTIQGFSAWASHVMKRNSIDIATVDEVHLFPGWAVKRPHKPAPGLPEADGFNISLHISGFASSRRTPEFLTRSQRAFLMLARKFASIPGPKPQPTQINTELLQDFPELLHLPPRPNEISDDYDVENLDAHFRNTGNNSQEMDDSPQLPHTDTIPAELARLHDNLESRLKLFWASSLPSRRIQVAVYVQSADPEHPRQSLEPQHLFTQEMVTGPDGHFSETFGIDWNIICAHPIAAYIASNPHVEHELLVEARIINTERAPELHETPTTIMHTPITHSVIRVISDIDDTVKISNVVDGARAIFNQVFVKDLEDTVIPEMGEWYDAMWKCGVRFHYVSNSPSELIPLINQFISISKLPTGSIRLRSYAGRSLFNGLLSAPANRKRDNVLEVLEQFPESQFVLVGDSGEQDLELYSSLAAERPDQIVGVFIRDVSSVGLTDPTGIKAGVGLTSSSMQLRSRGTVPFPSNIPSRIVPKRAASEADISPLHPGAIHIRRPSKKGSLPPTSYSFEISPDPKLHASGDSSSSISSTASSVSSSSHSLRQMRPTTEGEKRRWDLQNRVNRARLVIPSHIVLRVFEDPKECVEAEQITRKLI